MGKDDLIREADLALIDTKRRGHAVALYTPDVDRAGAGPGDGFADVHHTHPLAGALALAVDAKDSYTCSHSQTVSQLSALIATGLSFAPEHLARVRLASPS